MDFLESDFHVMRPSVVDMVPRIPIVMIMSGRTCHPCWVSSGRSTACLSSFLAVASKRSLSLQDVNSKSGTFKLSGHGGLTIGVAPKDA